MTEKTFRKGVWSFTGLAFIAIVVTLVSGCNQQVSVIPIDLGSLNSDLKDCKLYNVVYETNGNSVKVVRCDGANTTSATYRSGKDDVSTTVIDESTRADKIEELEGQLESIQKQLEELKLK